MKKVFSILVALTMWVAIPAMAIEFQAGTQMNIKKTRDLWGYDVSRFQYTYAGIDKYGHRFEAHGSTVPSVLWLDRNNGDLVRELRDDRIFLTEYPKQGDAGQLMGAVGKKWDLAYTRHWIDQWGEKREIRRTGWCEASEVKNGTYTIKCYGTRSDQARPLIYDYVVNSETGMWLRRSVQNESQTLVRVWEITKHPTVTKPAVRY